MGMTGMTEDERPGSESSVVHPDLRALRVIAHPVRLRMLGLLRRDGPSTATRLAQRLDINSGAASYHLRQLAGAGLIVEETGRGTARDRWWCAAHQTTDCSWADTEGALLEAGIAFARGVVNDYADQMIRVVEEMPLLPEKWQRASTTTDRFFLLTVDELRSMNDEIKAVLSRYRSHSGTEQAPEGAVQVSAIYQAAPVPGAVPIPEQEEPR